MCRRSAYHPAKEVTMSARHRFARWPLRLRPISVFAWTILALIVAACNGNGVHY